MKAYNSLLLHNIALWKHEHMCITYECLSRNTPKHRHSTMERCTIRHKHMHVIYESLFKSIFQMVTFQYKTLHHKGSHKKTKQKQKLFLLMTSQHLMIMIYNVRWCQSKSQKMAKLLLSFNIVSIVMRIATSLISISYYCMHVQGIVLEMF